MTYGRFAYLYDELMRDVPYQEWLRFINRQASSYGVTGKNLLDLACGTGELSIQLAEEGYHVTGVDLSADMLAVAKEKAEKKGYSLFFVEQDMSELEGLDQFDIIGIFCDSLNYLQTEREVVQTFERVCQHIKPEGLFLFDVHSINKINTLFIDQTYAYNGEDVSYIWQCFEGEHPNSVEHELTFFQLDNQTNQYHRYDELHLQRTFSARQYEQWLWETGFELLDVSADFLGSKPNEKSERIFFTARKQNKTV
ncbi:class I SAM-dependent DNA methyltransferase [Niallia endozanthoxylica]|uniref:Class I SAM-dependent methyltransferase n=1 Tax=Niallia endozanthoxylica TaxID=2036016 RepID=A0A5J5HVG2_9BACI|nr:class I SAM-dependent methyltransferase [Niallia endozanthoxylica]KAA9026375.1 class I SAM-dependent methyltransferase [Niallia endozanthoxylica]